MDWNAAAPFATGQPLGAALLAPTRIYVPAALAAMASDHNGLHALVHITGGGLTENLPRVMPEGLGAEIDLDAWELPDVFRWLQSEGGLEQSEMLRTINCGIGMVAIVDPASADAIAATLETCGERVFRLGHVVQGNGCRYLRGL